MEFLKHLLDFILHIDKHLLEIVTEYKSWTYLILFLIVFCETGLVVAPLLPGDSLLFVAGSIAALDQSPINIFLLAIIFFLAAFLGDNTNYFIGRFLGPKVFERNFRLLNKKHLEKTKGFYAKHGGKTVIVARFVPIVRTFAPFVAGVGSMAYVKFITYSMAGSFCWITLFLSTGYFFGQIEFVKEHFSLVTIGIILLSMIPVLIGFIRNRSKI